MFAGADENSIKVIKRRVESIFRQLLKHQQEKLISVVAAAKLWHRRGSIVYMTKIIKFLIISENP